MGASRSRQADSNFNTGKERFQEKSEERRATKEDYLPDIKTDYKATEENKAWILCY